MPQPNTRRPVVGAIALAALLAACGGETPPTAAEAAAARRQLVALVPADALVFAQCESLGTFLDRANALGREAAPNADPLEAADVLGPLARADTDRIARQLPFGIAVAFPGGLPTVVAIVPTTDPAGFAASLPAGTKPATAGAYVAVPFGSTYRQPAAGAAPHPLTVGLPATGLSLRADCAELVRRFRGLIDAGLASAERQLERSMELAAEAGEVPAGLELAEFTSAYVDAARVLVDSADVLELAVDLDGRRFTVDARLDVQADSELDGWSSPPGDAARRLAATLDRDDPLQLLGLWNERMVEWQRDFTAAILGAYPESARAAVRRLMTDYLDAFDRMGPGFAMSGKLAGGLRGRMVLLPDDPAGLTAVVDRYVADDVGSALGTSIRRTDDGADPTLRELAMAFDHEKLRETMGWLSTARDRATPAATLRAVFGGDGIDVRMRTGPGRAVTALGGDAGWREQATAGPIAASGPSLDLQRRLDQLAGSNPMIVYRFDLAALLRTVAPPPGIDRGGLARELPGELPMLFWAGVADRRWQGGFEVDLLGLASMMAGR